jgi:aminoglycoside phosphotransferase (APT) family kinase protein
MNSRSPKSVLDAFNLSLELGEPRFVPPSSELSVATGIDYLGSGESFDAFSIKAETYQLVLRVARRSPADLPRSVHQEVRSLTLDSSGIAPDPVAVFPDTDNAFGAVAVVTSSQLGTRLPEGFHWSENNLEKLAHTLAKLHAKRYDWRGDPADDAARYPTFSLLDEFDESHSWWQANAPETCAAKEVSDLIGIAREYVASHTAAFDKLTHFSLVHGDLNQTNLLLDDHGDFVLIDWEWAAVGDPAQDLALLGGLVPCAPWYAPLPPQALNHLLEAYAAASDQHSDLQALSERRNCWEVHERLWTGLHFRTTGREHEAATLLQGVTSMATKSS